MPDGFVTLTTLLRGERPVRSDAPPVATPGDDGRTASSLAALLDAIGHARLAALEAYDRSIDDLLATFGRDVLGRELLLARADVAALAESAVATYRAHGPVALVVAPADAGTLNTSLPVRVDPALAPGDLVVEVRDGAFESPIKYRLDAAIGSAAAAARATNGEAR